MACLHTYRNLFITFFISGIWHGADWTFMIWGALHGLGVMITRELERSRDLSRAGAEAAQAIRGVPIRFLHLDFLPGGIAQRCLVDRAAHLHSAWQDPQIPALMLAADGRDLAVRVPIRIEGSGRFWRRGFVRVSVAVCMVLYLCVCSSGGGAFIYFQF